MKWGGNSIVLQKRACRVYVTKSRTMAAELLLVVGLPVCLEEQRRQLPIQNPRILSPIRSRGLRGTRQRAG